jgi:hypothetical protein
MFMTRRFLITLVSAAVLAAASAALADLQEWKKTRFEVVGPEIPIAGDMETLREEFVDPLVCSGCHPRHFETWSKSYHAKSIRNAGFQALYLKYLAFLKMDETKKALGREPNTEDLRQCLFCHAPQVQLASDKVVQQISDAVATGDWDKARGAQISCVVCHSVTSDGKWASTSFKGHGVLFGPIRDPVPQAMHKSQYSELHTRSEFCGICHSVGKFNVYCSLVYEQQKAADPSGNTRCQDCHMKAQKNVQVAIGGKKDRLFHDHTFPGGRFPAMWKEAVQMDLQENRQGNRILVAVDLKNRITHNVPDG